MSTNTSLFLRIGEAKNLPAKDICGTSDPYCVIKVDNEHVVRTATVWHSLNPFWGEDFVLHLPNSFDQLSIYIYDEDMISGDDVIGKVTLSKDKLSDMPKDVTTWLQIGKVKKDDEIQGEIHLQIGRYKRKAEQQIKIKVIAARDLAVKDTMGASDPYVVLQLFDQKKVTRKVKSSLYPRWNESHEFAVALDAPLDAVLSVVVWDWDRLAADDFMGMVEFGLSELPLNQTINQWVKLSPNNVTMSKSSEVDRDLGQIRINARLMEERILPSEYYSPLIRLFIDSLSPAALSTAMPLKMLQEVMTLDLLEMANVLVKLFLGQGKIVEYLDVICTEEINETSNPNTLFRGNSLATKSIDQFMKIVGMAYLQRTVGALIDRIYEEHKYIELDPSRLGATKRRYRPSSMLGRRSSYSLIEQSCSTLLAYVSSAKTSILDSVAHIPVVMRLIFKMLFKRIEQRWPGSEYKDHKYVSVSGFLFLRFLTPAIMSPKLFLLRADHPDMRVSRTLTLVAKTVQNLGNLGLQIGLGKEQWMKPIHGFIINSVSDMKRFIDSIVCVDESEVCAHSARRRSVHEPSVTIKEGYLCKKRWCNSKWLRLFTFRKRYFWLKYDNLAYAKRADDQVRNTMSTQSLYAIERVEKKAFNRENIGQIIMRNEAGKLDILYFQAKDITVLYSWLYAIRKVMVTNSDLLDMHHPGIYHRRCWTCCLQTGQNVVGCSKSHSQVTLGDWRDPLDPDVEAQTIYSQLVSGKHILRQKHLERLEAVRQQDSCQSPAAPCRPPTGDEALPHGFYEEEGIASAAQLLDIVKDLENTHSIFALMETEKRLSSLVPRTTSLDEYRWRKEGGEQRGDGARRNWRGRSQ